MMHTALATTRFSTKLYFSYPICGTAPTSASVDVGNLPFTQGLHGAFAPVHQFYRTSHKWPGGLDIVTDTDSSSADAFGHRSPLLEEQP